MTDKTLSAKMMEVGRFVAGLVYGIGVGALYLGGVVVVTWIGLVWYYNL